MNPLQEVKFSKDLTWIGQNGFSIPLNCLSPKDSGVSWQHYNILTVGTTLEGHVNNWHGSKPDELISYATSLKDFSGLGRGQGWHFSGVIVIYAE
jgi:hypothetical protein